MRGEFGLSKNQAWKSVENLDLVKIRRGETLRIFLQLEKAGLLNYFFSVKLAKR